MTTSVSELFPFVLGVFCALVYLKQRRKARITDLIQTSIVSGILYAFSAGELVGTPLIALEAVIFDCNAFLIGSFSIWFIWRGMHLLDNEVTHVFEKT